ncbi:TIGR03943 family putative permease subunit [Nocardioides dongxiaopingii]|uniref:TIGR03943 family putative permease subunit n=1 Tax=Nocardioides dongxiaopingii TaxID=2576036 RepID=UPI00148528BE|nr:TIGR03943 family protein [Nocardioides dongxiaopingii]
MSTPPTSPRSSLRARLAAGTMSRPTQGLLMAFLGAVLVRLSLTDAYLRYVTPWMKWPILLSGVLLLGLAIGLVASDRTGSRSDDHDHDNDGDGDDGHGHGPIPLVTWLLVLPGLVTFVISPPQLGSYLAERRAGETQSVVEPASLTTLSSDEVVPVDVTEFIWRAQDGGTTLEGQPVELTGFVSYDKDDNWYVTRLTIGCCAADAAGFQVEVDAADDGAARPPRDQWVTVTGTYVPGSGTDGRTPPVLTATDVEQIATPKQTYE